MVYCLRCGAFNPEGSFSCSNCGVPLVAQKAESRPYHHYAHYGHYGNANRSHDHSGLGLLIVGIIIILIGLVTLRGSTQFWLYFWPIVLILIGVWVLVLGLRRSRRYRWALSR
ncbi:MAG: hypothetical protein LBH74_06000 [Nitrososphaerota archaeon]|uniref:hypothetical protein n=1 Tax=Candidatus Bathycorpusculum sp. TaxID=2994959 RepID=UPI00281A1A1F|nr:hypothetical protein [Candidatus Termitimicrobium sp.]MCL2432378.1 hypothetical protein [Candidatus Termitimicrobium sp.]MDR0493170.1 hypothetical protein [Nitrososphaerota archaeon]